MQWNRKIFFLLIGVLLLSASGGPGIRNGYFFLPLDEALAQDGESAKDPGGETAEDGEPFQEKAPCPECPDPAKVVLKGLEEKKQSIEQAQKMLEQEKKDLEKYEEQIDEKLTALETIKKQIQDDLALLEQKKSQRELEQEAAYEDKINRLVKMYSAMKPKNAALIVDKMDLEVAREIFFRMREAAASQILSFVDSEKAAKISERLAFKKK